MAFASNAVSMSGRAAARIRGWDGSATPSSDGPAPAVRGASDRRSPAGARRLWRQIRLGSALAQFGVTALAIGYIAIPLSTRRRASREAAELAVQRAIRRGYALTVRCWKLARILTLESKEVAALASEPPCILVANHPTLLDVVLLGSHFRQMDCIVNAGWTANSPFLARAIRAAGFVHNDGGAAAVGESVARLTRGRRLLVFPEGTRSPEGSFHKFHRGAAHMALESGTPIVAVAIHCRPRMLGGGRKWHNVAAARSDYRLRVLGRLDPADYVGAGRSIEARRMTEDLSTMYLEESGLAEA